MFNNKTLSALTAGSLALGTIAISPVSYAYPLHPPELVDNPPIVQYHHGEYWKMTVFCDGMDTHPGGSSFNLCFYFDVQPFPPAPPFTQTRYRWYMMTDFPLWTGAASKEGDQVFMNGVHKFPKSSLQCPDYMQWQLASKDFGGGHWRSWNNQNPVADFQHFNITMERLNKKCKPYKQYLEETAGQNAETSTDPGTGDPQVKQSCWSPEMLKKICNADNIGIDGGEKVDVDKGQVGVD